MMNVEQLFCGLFSDSIDKQEQNDYQPPLVSTPNNSSEALNYDHNKLKFGIIDTTAYFDENIVDIQKQEYLDKKSIRLGLTYYKEKYPFLDDIAIIKALSTEMNIPIPKYKKKEMEKFYVKVKKKIEQEEIHRERDIKKLERERKQLMNIETKNTELVFL